ncbi:hypothetical protein PLICRDRAFT_37455 [Plicaturopsis crispa FD-325 SS-3]|nr:hypothetical protein PLICRDRAFT_37455 [Plicaturopsis crispa FD-325 SS-3]
MLCNAHSQGPAVPMDIRSLLQANCELLLEQYEANLETLLGLQATLIDDILPTVEVELELDARVVDWAKEWLEDTGSIFQLSKRQSFTKSLAMEAIRKNLLWRINDLQPALSEPASNIIHCLPTSIRDPYGRPILVIRASDFGSGVGDPKALLLATFERLRILLKGLSDEGEWTTHGTRPPPPVLQYVVLLDLKGVSVQSINIDALTWTVREAIPRFPGMLAAVFMINYTWAHAGMWAVVKRVLPTSALSRVLFPTNKELFDYFTVNALPRDYGGDIPSLEHLEDPLRPADRRPSATGQTSPELEPSNLLTDVLPAPQRHVQEPTPPPQAAPSISATSALNPFFGYPVTLSSSPSGGVPALHHGRRRKRDLLRTLALLWWMRYGAYMRAALWVVFAGLAVKIWTKRLARFPNTLITWRPGRH